MGTDDRVHTVSAETSLRDTAYAEASKVDALTNELLTKYPPEKKENVDFWKIYMRTITSSFNLIAGKLPCR